MKRYFTFLLQFSLVVASLLLTDAATTVAQGNGLAAQMSGRWLINDDLSDNTDDQV